MDRARAIEQQKAKARALDAIKVAKLRAAEVKQAEKAAAEKRAAENYVYSNSNLERICFISNFFQNCSLTSLTFRKCIF